MLEKVVHPPIDARELDDLVVSIAEHELANHVRAARVEDAAPADRRRRNVRFRGPERQCPLQGGGVGRTEFNVMRVALQLKSLDQMIVLRC